MRRDVVRTLWHRDGDGDYQPIQTRNTMVDSHVPPHAAGEHHTPILPSFSPPPYCTPFLSSDTPPVKKCCHTSPTPPTQKNQPHLPLRDQQGNYTLSHLTNKPTQSQQHASRTAKGLIAIGPTHPDTALVVLVPQRVGRSVYSWPGSSHPTRRQIGRKDGMGTYTDTSALPYSSFRLHLTSSSHCSLLTTLTTVSCGFSSRQDAHLPAS